MKRTPAFQKITVKVGLAALVIGTLVGVLLGFSQLYLDLQGHREDIKTIVARILNAADPPARRAILTLDTALAQEVVNGLISYDFISSATISDELGNVLASVDQPRQDSKTRWLTALFADDAECFDIALALSQRIAETVADHPPLPQGRLSIMIDTDRALSTFYDRVLIALTSGILHNVAVVLLLLGVFHALLTKPLLRVIEDLAAVDPDHPSTPIAPLPRRHEHDELGLLRATGNRFIASIARRMVELQDSNSALAAEERRFRDYASSASDWFWELDENLRFVELPDSLSSAGFGSDKSWIGKTHWELEGADLSDPKWARHMEDMQAHREFRHFRMKYRLPDGRIRKLELSGVPYFRADGSFRGYRGVASDITDAVRTEERLAHTANLESLGRLTGGIAHDFNNLLAIVQGNLELLQEDLQGNPHLAQRVETAIKATGRGSELTQQLLAVARRQKLDTKPVDLNQIVAHTEAMLRRVLESSIHIEKRCAPDLWITEIDSVRMENAIINLAINSRDAMPDGGHLVFETANVTIAADTASAIDFDGPPGDYIRLSVTDTGSGMSADVLKRMFEPFYTTKEGGRGTGLGLSQIHGFIEQSGGYIAVQSEPGKGTTIRLYLPRSTATQVATEVEEKRLADTSQLPSACVLIVEDNVDLRHLARNIVEGLGLSVLESGSGEDALVIAKETPTIDLLLTDIVLTGPMNGHDVAMELARIHPRMEVIFMSGYADRALPHLTRRGTDTVMLQKPFRRKDLINAIVGKLTRHRLPSETPAPRADPPDAANAVGS